MRRLRDAIIDALLDGDVETAQRLVDENGSMFALDRAARTKRR
jgi:hypothetical protein